MRVVLAIFILFFSNVVESYFATLPELQSYADKHPENVPIENEDPFYPDFSNFYYRERSNIFQRMLIKIGILKAQRWNPDSFKILIEKILAKHQQEDTSQKVITVPTDAQFIFFGDLYGAYHSLVRSLEELHRQGIIDQTLTIRRKNCYIIFLGNIINRSPYSLETLTVIAALLDKNPDRVICLQGEQETPGRWENYTMREQLQAYASNFLQSEDIQIPLSTLLNKFFTLLPKRVLIHHKDTGKETIFAVHREFSEEMLKPITTEALIMGSQAVESVRSSGLQYRGFFMSTPVWSLISCPVLAYRSFYIFHYDSFAILQIGETLEKSSIASYDQDIEKKDGFIKKEYDLIYGIEIKNRSEINAIHVQKPHRIGSSIPLQGGAGGSGTMYDQGLEVAVYNFNKMGGHKGIYVETAVFDDQLNPELARKNIEFLMKHYQVYTIILPGGPTIYSYLDLAKEGKIIILFPGGGDEEFRKPEYKMIHFAPSYKQEVQALINYEIDQNKAKNFAFFFQNDEFGKAYLEPAHEVLKKRGITTWTDIPYTADQTDFKKEVELLRKANPDAIGFFAIPSQMQEFLAQVNADFFLGRNLFGIALSNNSSVQQFLEKIGIRMAFSSVVPNPRGDLEILKDYRAAMDHIGYPYDAVSLEPFIGASIYLDAIKHMKPGFTKEDILKYLESHKNYNFKGLMLTFNPKNRSYDQPVWINSEDGRWFPYNVKTGTFSS
jgi:branched-chain amino acid transport system substrate-binding protein